MVCSHWLIAANMRDGSDTYRTNDGHLRGRSSEVTRIAQIASSPRARAGLPPLRCRHFIDFAQIASAYVGAAGSRSRVTRVYALGVAGPRTFCSRRPVLLD